MKKKLVILVLALALTVTAVVGSTLAWLTATTGEVKNTFTTANIGVTLTETFNTDTNNDGTNDKWQAQMIPGFSYSKDPVVTVDDDSVDCYLFVKFEEKNNASTYLTYTSNLTTANEWTQGDDTNIPANVWYRKVQATDTTKSWQLLAGNTTYPNGVITVNGTTVTKATMETAAKAELVYTAYASQLYSSNGVEFTAAQAWANVAG